MGKKLLHSFYTFMDGYKLCTYTCDSSIFDKVYNCGTASILVRKDGSKPKIEMKCDPTIHGHFVWAIFYPYPDMYIISLSQWKGKLCRYTIDRITDEHFNDKTVIERIAHFDDDATAESIPDFLKPAFKAAFDRTIDGEATGPIWAEQ